MKKLAGLFILAFIFCMPAMAQDFAKYEVGGGVDYRSFDNTNTTTDPNGSRLSMVGWSAYGDYHIWKFINIAADFSGTYNRNNTFGNTSIYSFLGGPQFYPFGHNHKITVFGQLLFGGGVYLYNLPSQNGFAPVSTSYAGLVWMGGGGIDVRVRKRWAIRVIQADYEQTRFFSNFPSQGNYRVSVGLLYRFGVK
jgi:Outer membrane protein beta-barrel domain